MEPLVTEEGQARGGDVVPSDPLASDAPPAEERSESSSCGSSQARSKTEPTQGPSESATPDHATCDDFHIMWSELEAYLAKRFAGSPQSLVSLSRVVDHIKRQRLRVEELAFLIGHSFPDAPDVSLCMSLFLPDRTLIHAGNPAAAMCTLIQNMAPDKYVIFNSILKSCMAQKTQRGSRDILLHRMQLLFRGHPLVIRAIRKLLVQQFCVEKNGGVIRKDQAVELTKPFDDEPLQVHSAFRLAYQVGLSGGCSERARVLASNVIHLIRMFMSKRLEFSTLSDELDRLLVCFPSWIHVAEDIKRLILSISDEDIQIAREMAKLVKLLAARNPVACGERDVCLRYLCDLFLNGVSNPSVTLRMEVDHLISQARRGDIPASLAMQRIASLLSRYPDCSEKLGVLIRLFRDVERDKRRRQSAEKLAAQASPRNEGDDQGLTNSAALQSLSTVECSVNNTERSEVDTNGNAATNGESLPLIGVQLHSADLKALVRKAAELVCRHIAPCRFRSQALMIQLMGYSWAELIFTTIDDWNAGRLSEAELVASLEATVAADPSVVEVLQRLIVVFEARGGTGPGRAALTKQQYDSLPRNGSYRKLPDEWPASECSGRDRLSWQVFNDGWALFPDSSESQARYMNRHEEALLSLADSRYDWDLRIGRLESCLRKLEEIAQVLMKVPRQERKNCTVRPSFFKQTHIACFRRIFGADTEQVLSCLWASPLASLDTIYTTLEFKLVQWKAMGEILGAYWTSQEQPHYAGAIDFKKRFVGDKRGGVDAEELRTAEGRDGRSKAARIMRNDA